MLALVRVRSEGCPAREGVAACRGRSCRCGPAADRTPALQNGWTTLHLASYSGHLAVVRTLLDHGADVAAKAEFGGTSLHKASERGHPAVVQTLLDHGADVAARDNVGAAGGRARKCIAREDALDPMS